MGKPPYRSMTTRTPTVTRAIKGMKWMVYTMDTPATYYKSYKEARSMEASCDTISFKRYQWGYEEIDSNGRTHCYERISSVNEKHIECVVIDSIQNKIDAITYVIDRRQEIRDCEA